MEIIEGGVRCDGIGRGGSGKVMYHIHSDILLGKIFI